MAMHILKRHCNTMNYAVEAGCWDRYDSFNVGPPHVGFVYQNVSAVHIAQGCAHCTRLCTVHIVHNAIFAYTLPSPIASVAHCNGTDALGAGKYSGPDGRRATYAPQGRSADITGAQPREREARTGGTAIGPPAGGPGIGPGPEQRRVGPLQERRDDR